MKYKVQEYGTDVDILISPEVAVAFPCIVSNTGVSANAEGRKIIKAGTPLYGNEDYFMNRQTVLSTTGTTVYGVARWDIDVTNEEKTNATILVEGWVDYLKLDESVQALITTDIKANLDVKFIKGRKA